MPFFFESRTSNSYGIIISKILIYNGSISSPKLGISWNGVAPNNNEQFQGGRRCRFLSAKMTVEIDTPCSKFLCRKSTRENELGTQLHLFLQAKKKKNSGQRSCTFLISWNVERDIWRGQKKGVSRRETQTLMGNRISFALFTIHMFVKKQEAGKTCMPDVEEKPVCTSHTGEIVQEQFIHVKIWPMSFCQGC